jgi:hypothetical protein
MGTVTCPTFVQGLPCWRVWDIFDSVPGPVRLTVDIRNFILGEWLGRDVILRESFKSQKVQVG